MQEEEKIIADVQNREFNPRPTVHNSWVVWLSKRAPVGLLLIAVLMLTSLFIDSPLLEPVVTLIPQELVVMTGILLMVSTMYLKTAFVYGLAGLRESVTRLDAIVLTLLLGLMAIITVLTTTSFAKTPIVSVDAGTQLRVSTYNKLFSNDDLAAVVNTAVAQNPDIMSFQEIKRAELEVVRETLGFSHSFMTNCQCRNENSEIGIVSRYPIRSTEILYESVHGSIMKSFVTLDIDTEIVVYSVHMPWPLDVTGHAKRAEAYDLLRKSVSLEQSPIVIMGDFNTAPYAAPMRRFANALSNQVQLAVERQYWPNCTYYGLTDLACARIDHIFVPANAQVEEIHVAEEGGGSDHRPVTAQFHLQ